MICAWWDRDRLRWNVLIDGQVGWTHGICFMGGARTATRERDPLPEGGEVLPAAWIEAWGPLRVEQDGCIMVEDGHAGA
jgi:hypothetical protein